MKNRLRPRPCMECGGKFQTGGVISAAPNPALVGCPDGYAPDATGKCVSITSQSPVAPTNPIPSNIPAMDPNQTGTQGGNRNEGALNRGETPTTPEQDQYAVDPRKKKTPPVDPYFAFRGFTNGLAWLSGIVDRRRQNQYMQAQFANLGQNDAMPVENSQPNPFSLYAKYGGSLKKYQQGGRAPIKVDNPNDPRLKAYQDSLSLYNKYPDNVNGHKYFPKEQFDPSFWHDVSNGEWGWENNVENTSFKGKMPIGANLKDGTEMTYLPVFKKPVQPYVMERKDYPIKTLPKAQVRGTITPSTLEEIPQPKGDYIYGPANSVIGINTKNGFVPYTGENGVGVAGSQRGYVNQADTDLMKDKKALSEYLRGKGIQFKRGGWIPNNLKKGRCTPAPNPDCPVGSPQYNLAQTFKKHHGFHKQK